MAIESMVALGLATTFLVGFAWYASRNAKARNNAGEEEE